MEEDRISCLQQQFIDFINLREDDFREEKLIFKQLIAGLEVEIILLKTMFEIANSQVIEANAHKERRKRIVVELRRENESLKSEVTKSREYAGEMASTVASQKSIIQELESQFSVKEEELLLMGNKLHAESKSRAAAEVKLLEAQHDIDKQREKIGELTEKIQKVVEKNECYLQEGSRLKAECDFLKDEKIRIEEEKKEIKKQVRELEKKLEEQEVIKEKLDLELKKKKIDLSRASDELNDTRTAKQLLEEDIAYLKKKCVALDRNYQKFTDEEEKEQNQIQIADKELNELQEVFMEKQTECAKLEDQEQRKKLSLKDEGVCDAESKEHYILKNGLYALILLSLWVMCIVRCSVHKFYRESKPRKQEESRLRKRNLVKSNFRISFKISEALACLKFLLQQVCCSFLQPFLMKD